jgi:hypothetical protein
MKIIISVLACILIGTYLPAQIYLAKTCDLSFFSKSVIEDIEAVNKSSKPVLNTATGEILVKVPVRSFEFKSQLMQDHFNEDYMETEKFPFAIFKGKINETIDYSKDTTNNITVTGTMNMHGVDKPFTAEGTLTVKQGIITIASKFKIRMADYDIKVPSLYVKNIAEQVEITISSVLEPYKKS